MRSLRILLDVLYFLFLLPVLLAYLALFSLSGRPFPKEVSWL